MTQKYKNNYYFFSLHDKLLDQELYINQEFGIVQILMYLMF